MEWKNKNIFITGAAGFVGAHLTELLLQERSASVVCLVWEQDPLSYFFSKHLNEKTILVDADLKDKERMREIIMKYEITHIFHLGAQAIVNVGFVNPYETIASNVMGTVNILEAARGNHQIEAVVVASSDKAYGKDCDGA